MIAGLDYNTDIRVGVVRLLYRCLVELQSHVNRLQLNCLKCFSLIEGFCGNVGLYTVVDCIVVDNLIPQCVWCLILTPNLHLHVHMAVLSN